MTEKKEWPSEEDIQRLREAVESASIMFREVAEAFVNAIGPVLSKLSEQIQESFTLVPPPQEEDCPLDCFSCLFFCDSNGTTDKAREEGLDE